MTHSLPDILTLAQARAVSESLRPQLQGEQWVVNAASLREFDSSALAVLLECRRRAQVQGHTLVVEQAPAQLRQLAALYGVDSLLGL